MIIKENTTIFDLNLNDVFDGGCYFERHLLEDKDCFYILRIYGLGIKLSKKTEIGLQIGGIINSYFDETEKAIKKLKEIVLRIINVDQLENYIKKEKEISFEEGKEAKIKEIRDVFKV